MTNEWDEIDEKKTLNYIRICCHINILEKLFIVSNCQTPFNEIKISNAPLIDATWLMLEMKLWQAE